ncbi:MAG: DinB family protein, partial [Gemmatimonadaceae bacterium]
MALDPITSLASIRAELEGGWKLFDDAFDRFDAHQWAKKFGKTWTYADQPWHLAYFDAMIAKHVAGGPNIPETDRLFIRSMGEMNAWNQRELGRRSSTHSVEDSLAAMRAQRAVMRTQLASMSENDLDTRAWMPLIFGWSSRRGLLQA